MFWLSFGGVDAVDAAADGGEIAGSQAGECPGGEDGIARRGRCDELLNDEVVVAAERSGAGDAEDAVGSRAADLNVVYAAGDAQIRDGRHRADSRRRAGGERAVGHDDIADDSRAGDGLPAAHVDRADDMAVVGQHLIVGELESD